MKTPFDLFVTWLKNERKTLSKVYLLSGVQGLMYLSIPLCIQGIITYTMAGRFTSSLFLIAFVAILAVVFLSYFQLWQLRINETINQKLFATLTDRISSLLQVTSDREQISFKINQFFDVVTLQKGVGKILLDFTFAIISIVIGLLILPVYSSWFLIFTLLMVGGLYFIIRTKGRGAIQSNLETSRSKYRLAKWLQESTLKIIKEEDDEYEKSDKFLDDYLSARKKHFKSLEWQFKGIMIFNIVFVSILLIVGIFLVQSGELNIGQFVATEIIIFLIINSVEKLIFNLDTCYDVVVALVKIDEMFAYHPEISFLDNEPNKMPAAQNYYSHHYSKKIKMAFYGILIAIVIVVFLPWTQTIRADGKVTVINPEKQPQTIHTRISGRIEKWYVSEGQYVKKGDTIAFISEVKDEYLDPSLLTRSESQIKSKEQNIVSYENKINSIDEQVDALTKNLQLKTEQLKNKRLQGKNKVVSDSMEMVTAKNNYIVAEEQLKRYEELLKKDVISKTDFENRKIKLQDAGAKMISAENKWAISKNELLNIDIELNSIRQEFNEKLMKAESEKFSTFSTLYDAEATLTKMQNQLANYSIRQNYYYVLAPQDGLVMQTFYQGIGEIVKDGASICSIVPESNEQSVEVYVDPIDLPLIEEGRVIQLQFDGWPAFVFSGWPGVSFGTYSAEVISIDRNISDNGKFRVLAMNKLAQKWPEAIKPGGGVEGFVLLKDVPLIYELWRKANGFPPEFYNSLNKKDNSVNKDKKEEGKREDK
ncbi:MAG: HlyD family efflux transporter periplasmic adaptor subunit [Sphingobacteriaceae bacterium]|nr:HlyD family efflux transporter periplasmic adaptor subunit [Sphingobacteriaceae bacterium]